MPFQLDNVVPWGRSFDEYRRIFSLSEDDFKLRILGCADGPASFNAESHRLGGRAVSCDPLYHFDRQQIEQRIAATFDVVIEQTRQNAHQFIWEIYRSVEELGVARRRAMDTFLTDYDHGRLEGRYLAAELPSLPLADGAFDLALCSHFLFLYSTQLDERFHCQSVLELIRVANEVRIFPLQALDGKPSPYLEPVSKALSSAGHQVTIEPVAYEFQRGGNRMMRIRTRPKLNTQ